MAGRQQAGSAASWAKRPILRALTEAIVTMLAALITMACALALDPEPGPAVLAVVLCVTLSRSQLDRDRRGRLEAAAMLPLIALAALGVGTLLLHARWLGAVCYVSGMFVAIWLRRFGLLARRVGSLIALPFVVILATPYTPSQHAGQLLTSLLPVIVALLALGSVSLMHALGQRLGLLAPTRPAMPGYAPNMPAHENTLRPSASARMATQMAIALGLAFVIGFLCFPQRWAWIVLTAYIVNSGNRGRLDVAYKSVLRVLGAAAGTAAATLLANRLGAHDTTTVMAILAALFVGIWLRPLGYAWWALCVTLSLALLQDYLGEAASPMLWLRLEEIIIGATIGVCSAWFVLPVDSHAVLRRRIADALAALSEALDPTTATRDPGRFDHAMALIAQVAPAFRARRWATRRFRPLQPADWIDALNACHAPAITWIESGENAGSLRKALGATRKALRQPDALHPALLNLRDLLLQSPQPAAIGRPARSD